MTTDTRRVIFTWAALSAGVTLACGGCSTGSRSGASAPATATPASGASTSSANQTGAAGGAAAAAGGTVTPPPSGAPITTFATGLTPTLELHVATTGSDSAGDGSQANPFATIRRAAQGIRPGTAIRVHPGTYAGGIYLSNVAGVPAAPIWIGGLPGGARPVIRGGATGMQVSGARYMVLHDLEVTGSTQNGLNFDDGGQRADPDAARYVVFQNLYLHDLGSGGNNDGLKLSGIDDFYVLDCTFARVSAGSGIDQVGCHSGLIARCRFESMGSNAVQLKGGTRDMEVRWCTFVDAGQRGINIGGSTGDVYFRPPLSTSRANVEATDVRVLANVFVRGRTPFAFVGATNSIAAHNTVIDPERWLLRILQEKTTGNGYTFAETQGCTVQSTIFYFARGSVGTEVNVGPNTQPGTYTFRNNLYYAHDAPGQSAPRLPAAETGTVTANPAFTDVAGGDYSLAASSPAIGAGAPQSLVGDDMAGAPFRPAPGIGAYEGP